MFNKKVTSEQMNLVISNDTVTTVIMPSLIKQIIEFDQMVVVRLQPNIAKFINENIFGVSYSGKIKWQIATRKYVFEKSPYTNISKDGQMLKAHNWDGTDLLIDPVTGDILKSSYSR